MIHLGKLYLIPVPISDSKQLDHIPGKNLELIRHLEYFVSENAKTARAFLKRFSYPDIQLAKIEELNQHSEEKSVHGFLAPLLAGHSVGLLVIDAAPKLRTSLQQPACSTRAKLSSSPLTSTRPDPCGPLPGTVRTKW